MTPRLFLPRGRIAFRPITTNDAYLVTRWRNLPDARAAFFNKTVVTPDTHAAFIANRKPHDLIWIIEDTRREPIGMVSLAVDPSTASGEYGRLVIDPDHQHKRYAKETDYLTLYAAFEWLLLDSMWLDAYQTNTP